MGNDYDARKRNKKLNKRAGREAAEADDKSKKQRSKGRPKVSCFCPQAARCLWESQQRQQQSYRRFL